MDEGTKNKLKNVGAFAGRIVYKGTKSLLKNGAKGIAYSGKCLWKNRREITGAGKGIANGIGNVCTNIYGLTKSDEDFARQIEKIKEQSREFEILSQVKKIVKNKVIILDSIGVSATYLFGYLHVGEIPQDVLDAYNAAYPGMASAISLEEVIKDKSDEQLEGLVSGIKGKLFELRYANYLNDGHLPDGYRAELAPSATMPGWDLIVVDSNNLVDQELQLKATESVEYVQKALERYPDINVVTTEEVYNQLAMKGIAENIIDSGISNEELTNVVKDSLELSPNEIQWGPPLIPLLLIGYSVWRPAMKSQA